MLRGVEAVLQGCVLEGCGGGVWVWDSSTAWDTEEVQAAAQQVEDLTIDDELSLDFGKKKKKKSKAPAPVTEAATGDNDIFVGTKQPCLRVAPSA
ncbi:hypothetical protein HaLaN_18202 [Haematococcus lacustris]|uniref:Uncharacterized protein n=1 Tax=Haematococcus lacustris TaxID=44745 RepID=A0A699ZMZ4_HAELA|nr:hypothetical protein HaLaN_18202 [Haematococcus lacustris]